MKVKIAHKQMA